LTPDQTYGVDEILPPGYMHHDESVGSAGGNIVNDAILDVSLGDGVNGVNYDFCDVLPGSISGNVADCLVGMPLSGVTVQLFDANGNILKTTTTNDQGNYDFTGLMPDQTYGVAEILPPGYIHNDETVGSAGGAIINDEILNIPIGDGVNSVNNDFCDIRPASISGSVADCIAGVPLSGVTVQLLDANNKVIETTTTDGQGDYSFTNLKPGQVYGVSEILPTGYVHNDETVGSVGGNIVNYAIVDVPLGDGVNAVNYDFCDVLPGSISGKVWDDTNGNCSFQPGVDIPLAGVKIDLINSQGTVVATTTTDAQGDYMFSNLLPNTYTVHEHVPTGYEADMDTVGTIGGITIGGQNGPTVLDAISLNYENVGINYNFCVMVPPPPPPPPPPQIPPPFIPPLATGVPAPTPPLVIPPYQPLINNPDLNAGDALGYTWHLSIVDAGYPRGAQNQQVSMDLSSISVETATWMDMNMVSGELIFVDANGHEVRRQVMGFKNAIPIVGDFNGDGTSQLGFYVDGQWFIDLNGDGRWDTGDLWAKMGTRDDQPVVGDWNGDGKDDIGIYGRAWPRDPHAIQVDRGLPSPLNKMQITGKRKKNVPPDQEDATSGGRDLQRGEHGKVRADVIDHVFHYGTAVEKAIVGDWMGTGLRHIGVFRNGKWYLDIDGDGRLTDKDLECVFGQEGDIPVVGDWTGDGIEKIGVYRNGTFYLDTNNNHKLDADDKVIQLGQPGDLPVVGNFDGSGKVEVGVYHADAAAAVQTATKAPAMVK
jgi:5-hydroxyisourate hydrolase-like protein (transthyretin family)